VSPLEALYEICERAIRAHGPVAVAFSGGRDSSLLLAAAAEVSARRGAAPPAAITLRFPGAPQADEDVWQEQVISELNIADWTRISIGAELDFVGPLARRHLLRDGVLFPANAHSVLPLLEAADGRSLLVGLGGDELLSPHQSWAVHELLGRRRSFEPRDLLSLALATLPAPVRGRLRPSRRGLAEPLHWLQPQARRLVELAVRTRAEEPILWGTAARHAAARRDVVCPRDTMEILAVAEGGVTVAPFLEDEFVGALAHAGGRAGWGTRTATMEALFSGVLPREILSRKSKAGFNRVFFAEESRAFASAWTGRGVDPELVDAEALRREWLSPVPDFRTALLLQTAWLAERDHQRPGTK